MPSTPPTFPGETLLDPAVFVRRITAAARDGGFTYDTYGEAAGQPLFALTKRTAGPRPRIYLSAGIHGNEPAPPFALLDLIERGVFDARAVWFLCPLLNPTGFTRRTRENREGIDLNRDFKALAAAESLAHTRWLQRQPNFHLAICLHEDWEAGGFYLYELNSSGGRSLAHSMITAVAGVCPIETATVIDGRPITEPAIIHPVGDPALRELWPESIYLRAHHCQLGYTIETPSALPLEQRISALGTAVTAAITALLAR